MEPITELKVWLDDERSAPEGWTWVKTASECINILSERRVAAVSLDHDLGDEQVAGTGNTVLLWLEQQAKFFPRLVPREIKIHTANTSARIKMELALRSITRILAEGNATP